MDQEGRKRHITEMELTAAHSFREATEDFFNRRWSWQFHEMRRVAQDCLSDERGTALEGALIILDVWELHEDEPCGDPDDIVYTDDEGKAWSRRDLMNRFEQMCRMGLGRVMTVPHYASAIFMRVREKRAKDIAMRFFEGSGLSIHNYDYEHGQDLVVIGPKGSGKTYYATAYIVPDDIRLGMNIVGNIELREDPGKNDRGLPYYQEAHNLSEMLVMIGKNRLDEVRTSRLFDEMGVIRKRTKATSISYQTEADILRLERKLWCKTTGVLQRVREVPSDLAEFASVIIQKPSTADKSLVDIIVNNRREFYKGVKGPIQRRPEVEALGLPFFEQDTDGWGLLVVDFNFDELMKYISTELQHRIRDSGVPLSKWQVEKVVEWLESHAKPMEIDDELRTRVFMELKESNGWSYRMTEDHLGLPREHLRRRAHKYGLAGAD